VVAGSVTLSQSKDEEVKKLLGGDMEKMRNTKGILMSILMIGVVAMAAGAGTFAYFSDTETSTGNTFTAGTLDLKVNSGDSNVVMFNVNDVKPGDSGSAEINLSNAGSLDGYLDINFSNVVDNDPTLTDPEDEVDDTQGDGQGELADNLDILAYIDENGNSTYDAGTDALVYDGKAINIAGEQLSNYSLTSGASKTFRIEWSVDSGVGNVIQDDEAGFDIEFELAQTTGQ